MPRARIEQKAAPMRTSFIVAALTVLGLVLAWAFSPWWLLLDAFVGLNMLQAAFTGFCPAAAIFHKLGLKPGAAFACGVPRRS